MQCKKKSRREKGRESNKKRDVFLSVGKLQKGRRNGVNARRFEKSGHLGGSIPQNPPNQIRDQGG